MRQNTARIAFGIVFSGFSASPEATATISVPWKENPAIMKIASTPPMPPTKGASPTVQLLKPGDPPTPITPKIISTPTTRNTITSGRAARAQCGAMP